MKTRYKEIISSVIISIALAIFMISVIAIISKPTITLDKYEIEEIVVCSGDTLSKYYNRYTDGSCRYNEYIYEVKKLNNKETSELKIGEIIKVYKLKEAK